MSWWVIVGVGVGGALGTWLRWMAGLWLNPILPRVPLGTLLVNLVGGLLVGIALAWLDRHADLAPVWRPIAVTGFLGGLTTFSAFSAESLQLLQRNEVGWALVHGGLHVFGALLAAAIGHRLLAA